MSSRAQRAIDALKRQAKPSSNGHAKKGGSNPPQESFTDPYRLSRLMVRDFMMHEDGPTVRHFRESYWLWSDGVWRQVGNTEMEASAARYLKQIYDRDWPEWISSNDEDDKKVPKITQSLVGNVLLAVRGDHSLPTETPFPCWLEGRKPKAKNLFAVDNGLLDIDAWLAGRRDCLLPHSPLWFSTAKVDYPFKPGADCPKWRKVHSHNLSDDVGKQLLVQQIAGYLLSFDQSLQKYFEFIGDGANGKSVLIAVLTAMLGEENCSAVPLELFGDKFRLAGTLGKLANLVAEVGEMDKVAEGHLKCFVSGDAMEFEQKFKQPFRARPTARVIFSCNNPPQYSDKSDGVFRRRIPLQFKVQITDDERILDLDKVAHWQQSGEMPGVLNWALEGLRSLRESGAFAVPKSCKDFADSLRVDSDPARRFLIETYQAGEGKVAKHVLYAQYREWCGKHGHHAMADIGFGRSVKRVFKAVKDDKIDAPVDELGADGLRLTGTKRVNAYAGLALRDE